MPAIKATPETPPVALAGQKPGATRQVGETKNINGHEYRLNENHRWERVKNESAQPNETGGATAPMKPDKTKVVDFAKSQIATVTHKPLAKVLTALHDVADHSQAHTTKNLEAAHGDDLYGWMHENAGKKAAGGQVLDLGQGRFGFVSNAGSVVMWGPQDGDGKYRLSFTADTGAVRVGMAGKKWNVTDENAAAGETAIGQGNDDTVVEPDPGVEEDAREDAGVVKEDQRLAGQPKAFEEPQRPAKPVSGRQEDADEDRGVIDEDRRLATPPESAPQPEAQAAAAPVKSKERTAMERLGIADREKTTGQEQRAKQSAQWDADYERKLNNRLAKKSGKTAAQHVAEAFKVITATGEVRQPESPTPPQDSPKSPAEKPRTDATAIKALKDAKAFLAETSRPGLDKNKPPTDPTPSKSKATLAELQAKQQAAKRPRENVFNPRQEHADRAAAHGIKEHEYRSMAGEIFKEHHGEWAAKNAARAHARKLTGLTKADIDRLENQGHDHASKHPKLKKLDVWGQEIARQHGGNLGWGDGEDDGQHDYAEKLWNLIREGNEPQPRRHTAAFLDHVDNFLMAEQDRANKSRGKTPSREELDAVPFRKSTGLRKRYRKWRVKYGKDKTGRMHDDKTGRFVKKESAPAAAGANKSPERAAMERLGIADRPRVTGQEMRAKQVADLDAAYAAKLDARLAKKNAKTAIEHVAAAFGVIGQKSKAARTPKLPKDKPVPAAIVARVETQSARAMKLAYELMRSKHVKYNDFRTALKNAWAEVKGELVNLYKEEHFAEDEPENTAPLPSLPGGSHPESVNDQPDADDADWVQPVEEDDGPSVREWAQAQAGAVLKQLASKRGARQYSAATFAADELTDGERELVRLFASLHVETDAGEKEEITREIVERLGEWAESGAAMETE